MTSKEDNIPHGDLNVKTLQTATTDQLRSNIDLSLQGTDELTHKILTEDALRVWEIEGWGLSVKLPTARYSEPGFMLVASQLGKELANRNWLIYDAPEQVQEKYWEITLAVLNKLTKLTIDDGGVLEGSFPMITGHHNRQRHTTGAPSARSIRLHHDHVLVLPPSLKGEPYKAEDFGLTKERGLMLDQLEAVQSTEDRDREASRLDNKTLLPYFLPNFIAFLEDSFEGHPLAIRSEYPHGYSFDVPNNSVSLAKILKQHYVAYKAAMDVSEYIEKGELGIDVADNLKAHINYALKHGRVVQPAFTFYLLPNDKNGLTVIISPMLTGIGGPERAGIKLSRDPSHPQLYSDLDNEKIVADVVSILPNV